MMRFFLGGLLILLAGCHAPAGRIVCFGDSLTSGLFLEEGTQAWPEILSTMVKAEVINAGLPGETSRAAWGRVETVMALKPSVVLLGHGGNDFLLNIKPSLWYENMAALVAQFQNEGIDVVVLRFYSDEMSESNFMRRDDSVINEWNGMYEKLKREFRVAVIEDVWGDIFGDPELMADDFHPNAEGHLKMAETIFGELKELGIVE